MNKNCSHWQHLGTCCYLLHATLSLIIILEQYDPKSYIPCLYDNLMKKLMRTFFINLSL